MVTVFIPKEIREGETRVAATPATVKKLVQETFKVSIESGAGKLSCFSDKEYEGAGATIETDIVRGYAGADLVFIVNVPTEEQAYQFREESTVISFLYPLLHPSVVDIFKRRRVNAYAMDAVPRITRAQKLDALSSQNNLAGYKAVLLAATELPKIFPMLMTAAGTIRPAKVVVMGAGVAGLQAIATAKRLGAIVEVSDVRSAVKEQVQSLGATYIEVPADQSMETSGGYAKDQSQEFLNKQAEITRQHLIDADVVITTALIPGKKAPLLVKEDVVKLMKTGSVIVDLAAEQGGNCELTIPGKKVVRHGVTIIGYVNLPATIPFNSSEMYAKNVLNVVLDNVDKKKNFSWNFEDEIVNQAMVVFNGEIRHQMTLEALQHFLDKATARSTIVSGGGVL